MKIKGIAASDGISVAKVYKLISPTIIINEDLTTDKGEEIVKLDEAFLKASKEIEKIKEKTLINLDEEHAMIFDAHLQILNDPEIRRQVLEEIDNKSYNAAFAYSNVTETFAMIFEAMDNEYMRERAMDVRDVSRRVLCHLLGEKMSDPTLIDEEVIVVANDLTPSDTAQLDKKYVKGFITNIGGRTSHSAIMARSLEIPAVVGTGDVLQKVNEGDIIILDGINGEAIVNPNKELIAEYKKINDEFTKQKEVWSKFKDKKTTTLDDVEVELAANIGSPDDLEGVLNNGAEGIGLYRTEFLYMNNSDFPTENEQFEAYKKVLDAMGDKKVVIRTLDIGGDKELNYLEMPKEMNPFLGHRALRLCLDKTDLFKTQLRALIRASEFGNLHVMFPMVATIEELRSAKALLKECEEELTKENVSFGDYKVGIMVEIPAVAILADQFAKEVDFFSIGTNDLIQYTFAADRMNEKVSYLYQPYNPSILRLIKMVIDASHKEGIWTGMCGEMAGDQIAAPILLGLGLDEFSMSATSILRTRHLFSDLSKNDMEKLAQEAVNLATNEEVKNLVKSNLKK
ncbi:phosphoenolpyruvate--protein phosphotransferase [Candidatus Izimaplasma bacterium ZiA1]|uniref:phosphoenolpyruvate--protein phosphotransferase n=1 Tax=Candidatus Izimoplasma sp. ZiA1 TaxID=2024899 RepID=UPI000BAA6D5F|nr:phosphoenolpyruvate--protein phosphotransferase [Candidatus Izimaplasma bacterium ZiA1]